MLQVSSSLAATIVLLILCNSAGAFAPAARLCPMPTPHIYAHTHNAHNQNEDRWDTESESRRQVQNFTTTLPLPEHAADKTIAERSIAAMETPRPPALDGRCAVNLDTHNLRWLHVDPPVLIVDDFLSSSECAQLMRLTTTDLPGDAGRIIKINSQTESGLSIKQRISTTWYVRFGIKIVAPLLKKVLDLLPSINLNNLEELQLVRYLGQREGFAWHLDALRETSATLEAGGQRVATVLVYLTDCEGGGGQTLFRDLKMNDGRRLAVTPKLGRALLFFPSVIKSQTDLGEAGDYGNVYFDETSSDLRTSHAGQPPNVAKHIAQLWVHLSAHTPVVFGTGLNKHKDAQQNIDDLKK
ncbi:hypothetical protein TrST_g2919 [Triparma strigata]|uniref:Fe2OG dioxygenase domain-containing protein n=1 Tax=Triparma strigata TaxID=1606541 RepID=A0A9W7BLU7_9STRA|nr:hypothetical protein TrST_g2919 [Triparma strigata]